MKSLLKLSFPFALVLVSAHLATAGVLINEVMYHSPTDNTKECYVELYNPDPVAANLAGWRFTRGIQFAFPTNTPTTLAAGAYLVVASDAATFTAKYPGVGNFVAGWSGAMSSHLKLENAAGQTINEVNFSNDGDWAARILTTNGFFSAGRLGWMWSAAHDGLGNSLELMNPNLPNAYGHNWDSSSVIGGTPGRANSVASANIAPIITGVAHSPIIPQPTDPVTVSARLIDERSSGSSLTLFYRDASTPAPPVFTAVPMFDDGGHNDGLAADNIFAAILPAQPVGTVIEFYLTAQDLEGNTRTYPNVVPPTNSLRTANCLYQVDGGVYNGSQPVYRMIMTEMERAELYYIGSGCPQEESDAEMNVTWISTDGALAGAGATQFRYNCGVRNRGHGSRAARPNNYHVNIPGDRKWKDLSGINLNSQYTFMQVLGSALFRRAGIPMAESRAVQVRVNSTNLMAGAGNSYGSYAANEQYNSSFAERAFPNDPKGNLYRGNRDQQICFGPWPDANFVWYGANYAQANYTNAYFKQNNLLENDWSDLIDLIAVLNSQNGHASGNYVTDVRARLNVEQWMKYFALNTIADNDETALSNGYGDDYGMFRGTNDTRFLLLPYDLDQILAGGNTATPPGHSIWRMNGVAAVSRFMKTPAFAPVYFETLKTYCDTLFSPAQMNPLIDKLMVGWVSETRLARIKAFNAAQVSNVLAQIPLKISISSSLPVTSGYPRTTTPTVTLFGQANAIETRSIRVNGVSTPWTAWTGSWTNPAVALNPGINRILVQSFDENGAESERAYADIWYDDGSVASVGSTIAASETWTAAGGPYLVGSTVTIPSGVTLTIEPGTTLYLGSAVNFVINNGGRLLAEGTSDAPIRFTVSPGSGVSWGGLTINGAGASPETRIAYTTFEGNANACIEVAGGTLYLDHSTFLTPSHPYLSLDGASFLVSSCVFPPTSAAFEPTHGTGGIKSGGRGIFRDCFFGSSSGYSDILDFTGGNRDLGQPILQMINNVFAGSSDDILDLDGTDAWIEGNIFLHTHKNGSPDSSSAVSGGNDGSNVSEVTIINNLFFDCDQAATAKQGNFFTMLNNTIVRTTKTGGEDTDSGAINVGDVGTTLARGFYLEGNVIVDAEKLVRNYDPAVTITFNNNILPQSWAGPGTNNLVGSPLLKHIPALAETWFTNWESAQVLRDWFSLLPGSPAAGTGPNGRDQGGVVPLGASISGAPTGTVNQTSATLRVGSVRSGFGIPTAGFPNGSGYTHYKYRLDLGAWSPENPTSTAITLVGLANGPHRVDVVGKRDSGWYQDDLAFGSDALVTTGRTWIVDTSYVPPVKPTVRLNEILAQNSTTLTNGGTTPDLIELYNYGPNPVDLTGMGLSDSATIFYKYTFPAGTPLLNPGQHLTLFADSQTAAPGIHLGFSLKANGDDVYLHDKAASGGALLDSIVFGLQAADYSIGRGVDGTWVLCRPTFGSYNIPVALGDQHHLRLNEWMADEAFLANNDFVELYNPEPLPVALGGCYFSDAEGFLGRSPIPQLSFIAPGAYVAFTADSDPNQGGDHLNFKLDAGAGIILLSDSSFDIIDAVDYAQQITDVSQGRSPNGSDTFVSFTVPTPGAPNPDPNGIQMITNITANAVSVLNMDHYWSYDNSGGTNFGAGSAWYQSIYSPESSWLTGQPLFGYEPTSSEYLPFTFRTPIPAVNQAGGHITVYFRTHFNWDGSLTNYSLVSTNFVDDGVIYRLNGQYAGSIRMSSPSATYNTFATGTIATEGTPEELFFTNKLVIGDNVLAAEVHQVNLTSSDVVFGMQLNAVQYTTNIITTVIGVPLVINEVLASNRSFTNAYGLTSDWIELFSQATNTLNISDLSLSNDPNKPRKYVFSPGTSIKPGEHLLLLCDNALPGSTNSTGFSLDADSGSIYLFNSPAMGGGLIDGLNYGLQTPDFSIGRIQDGVGTFALNVPTPGTFNTAAGMGDLSSLRINEWMADPSSGSDWFELYNGGSLPVSLGGLFFTDDLTKPTLSPVPALSFIGSGVNGFVKFIADNNLNGGANHVKFALSKSGEQLGLVSLTGAMIDGITFGSQGTGVSQGRFPDGTSTVFNFNSTASPAASNYLPLSNVVVNEVLSHTDPPLEDAVEFYNPTSVAVNIGGWFISNSEEDLKKYRVTDNTLIQSHSFKVFYEYEFNPTDGSSVPFTLNSAHGDRIYLSQADAAGNLSGYRAATGFGPAANGISFGRYTNSIGQVDFVPLRARTFGVDNPLSVDQFRTGTGAVNAYPLVGPVVINEVMFYPPLNGVEDDTQDEYVELLNVTGADIPLYDPLAPTNTWKVKGGIEFTFPENVTLPAGALILLVNFDPSADQSNADSFRARYGLGAGVRIFGPYDKNLSNSGESIGLYRSDTPQAPPHPDAGFVPYLLVEEVNYLSAAPWPAGADGTGSSLQRSTPTSFGNDPGNWFVAPPTAGRPNSGSDDSNGDGLPDAWQIQYFGSISAPNAAPGADPDHDNFSNYQEYLAGTNPIDANSALKFDDAEVVGGSTILQFKAVAGKSYTILYKQSLTSGSWLNLTNLPTQSVSGPISITDPTSAGGLSRFYRLVTPAL